METVFEKDKIYKQIRYRCGLDFYFHDLKSNVKISIFSDILAKYAAFFNCET